MLIYKLLFLLNFIVFLMYPIDSIYGARNTGRWNRASSQISCECDGQVYDAKQKKCVCQNGNIEIRQDGACMCAAICPVSSNSCPVGGECSQYTDISGKTKYKLENCNESSDLTITKDKNGYCSCQCINSNYEYDKESKKCKCPIYTATDNMGTKHKFNSCEVVSGLKSIGDTCNCECENGKTLYYINGSYICSEGIEQCIATNSKANDFCTKTPNICMSSGNNIKFLSCPIGYKLDNSDSEHRCCICDEANGYKSMDDGYTCCDINSNIYYIDSTGKKHCDLTGNSCPLIEETDKKIGTVYNQVTDSFGNTKYQFSGNCETGFEKKTSSSCDCQCPQNTKYLSSENICCLTTQIYEENSIEKCCDGTVYDNKKACCEKSKPVYTFSDNSVACGGCVETTEPAWCDLNADFCKELKTKSGYYISQCPTDGYKEVSEIKGSGACCEPYCINWTIVLDKQNSTYRLSEIEKNSYTDILTCSSDPDNCSCMCKNSGEQAYLDADGKIICSSACYIDANIYTLDKNKSDTETRNLNKLHSDTRYVDRTKLDGDSYLITRCEGGNLQKFIHNSADLGNDYKQNCCDCYKADSSGNNIKRWQERNGSWACCFCGPCPEGKTPAWFFEKGEEDCCPIEKVTTIEGDDYSYCRNMCKFTGNDTDKAKIINFDSYKIDINSFPETSPVVKNNETYLDITTTPTCSDLGYEFDTTTCKCEEQICPCTTSQYYDGTSCITPDTTDVTSSYQETTSGIEFTVTKGREIETCTSGSCDYESRYPHSECLDLNVISSCKSVSYDNHTLDSVTSSYIYEVSGVGYECSYDETEANCVKCVAASCTYDFEYYTASDYKIEENTSSQTPLYIGTLSQSQSGTANNLSNCPSPLTSTGLPDCDCSCATGTEEYLMGTSVNGGSIRNIYGCCEAGKLWRQNNDTQYLSCCDNGTIINEGEKKLGCCPTEVGILNNPGDRRYQQCGCMLATCPDYAECISYDYGQEYFHVTGCKEGFTPNGDCACICEGTVVDGQCISACLIENSIYESFINLGNILQGDTITSDNNTYIQANNCQEPTYIYSETSPCCICNEEEGYKTIADSYECCDTREGKYQLIDDNKQCCLTDKIIYDAEQNPKKCCSENETPVDKDDDGYKDYCCNQTTEQALCDPDTENFDSDTCSCSCKPYSFNYYTVDAYQIIERPSPSTPLYIGEFDNSVYGTYDSSENCPSNLTQMGCKCGCKEGERIYLSSEETYDCCSGNLYKKSGLPWSSSEYLSCCDGTVINITRWTMDCCPTGINVITAPDHAYQTCGCSTCDNSHGGLCESAGIYNGQTVYNFTVDSTHPCEAGYEESSCGCVCQNEYYPSNDMSGTASCCINGTTYDSDSNGTADACCNGTLYNNNTECCTNGTIIDGVCCPTNKVYTDENNTQRCCTSGNIIEGTIDGTKHKYCDLCTYSNQADWERLLEELGLSSSNYSFSQNIITQGTGGIGTFSQQTVYAITEDMCSNIEGMEYNETANNCCSCSNQINWLNILRTENTSTIQNYYNSTNPTYTTFIADYPNGYLLSGTNTTTNSVPDGDYQQGSGETNQYACCPIKDIFYIYESGSTIAHNTQGTAIIGDSNQIKPIVENIESLGCCTNGTLIYKIAGGDALAPVECCPNDDKHIATNLDTEYNTKKPTICCDLTTDINRILGSGEEAICCPKDQIYTNTDNEEACCPYTSISNKCNPETQTFDSDTCSCINNKTQTTCSTWTLAYNNQTIELTEQPTNLTCETDEAICPCVCDNGSEIYLDNDEYKCCNTTTNTLLNNVCCPNNKVYTNSDNQQACCSGTVTDGVCCGIGETYNAKTKSCCSQGETVVDGVCCLTTQVIYNGKGEAISCCEGTPYSDMSLSGWKPDLINACCPSGTSLYYKEIKTDAYGTQKQYYCGACFYTKEADWIRILTILGIYDTYKDDTYYENEQRVNGIITADMCEPMEYTGNRDKCCECERGTTFITIAKTRENACCKTNKIIYNNSGIAIDCCTDGDVYDTDKDSYNDKCCPADSDNCKTGETFNPSTCSCDLTQCSTYSLTYYSQASLLNTTSRNTITTTLTASSSSSTSLLIDHNNNILALDNGIIIDPDNDCTLICQNNEIPYLSTYSNPIGWNVIGATTEINGIFRCCNGLVSPHIAEGPADAASCCPIGLTADGTSVEGTGTTTVIKCKCPGDIEPIYNITTDTYSCTCPTEQQTLTRDGCCDNNRLYGYNSYGVPLYCCADGNILYGLNTTTNKYTGCCDKSHYYNTSQLSNDKETCGTCPLLDTCPTGAQCQSVYNWNNDPKLVFSGCNPGYSVDTDGCSCKQTQSLCSDGYSISTNGSKIAVTSCPSDFTTDASECMCNCSGTVYQLGQNEYGCCSGNVYYTNKTVAKSDYQSCCSAGSIVYNIKGEETVRCGNISYSSNNSHANSYQIINIYANGYDASTSSFTQAYFISSCKSGFELQNGECVCPTGTTYNSTDETCCAGTLYNDGKVCCPTGTVYNSTTYACCASGESVIAGVCCPNGKDYDSDGDGKTDSCCPEDTITINTDGNQECGCKEGFDLYSAESDDYGICLKSDEEDKCQILEKACSGCLTYTSNDNELHFYGCDTEHGYVLNDEDNNCSCKCAKGRTETPQDDIIFCTTSNLCILNSDTCQSNELTKICEASDKVVYNDTTYYYITSSNCPSGYHFDYLSETCCVRDDCEGKYTIDNDNEITACSTADNMKLEEGSCNCQCIEGYTYDKETDKCIQD